MKAYTFEYSNERLLKRTILVCFGVFFGITLSTVIATDEESAMVISIIVALILAGGLFYVNSRRIKRQGKAQLHPGGMVLDVYDKTTTIPFRTIQDYLTVEHNGLSFVLTLRDGTAFQLVSNTNYCDTAAFKAFVVDAVLAIKAFNLSNASDFQVGKAKNPYAKDWLIPFIWAGAILLGIAAVPVFIWGDALKIISWAFTAFILSGLWVAVKKARKEKRQK